MTQYRPILTVLALAAALCSPARVTAQPAGAPTPAQGQRPPLTLDAGKRGVILDSLYANLVRTYVEEDTAHMIVDVVRKRQRAGAYGALVNPSQFAEAVTTDLRRVNGDLHLSLRHEPGGGRGVGGPMIIRSGAGGPGGPGGGPIIVHGSPRGPGVAGGQGDSLLARIPYFRDAARQNFGFTKIEILPGNVGYLAVSGFLGVPGHEQVMAGALRFLERTDAIIIDVRTNRGGSGNMSHLLFSHFLPAQPVQTIKVTSRQTAEPRVQESIAEVPGPRRTDVPLYVLTSRGTGSAAEEFAFVLKSLGRATIVGDRTAGAGHMVSMVGLPDGFTAGVSITRVSDPRTGREFEGIGVEPDIAVEQERALATAHVAALKGLAAKAPDDAARRRIELLTEWIEAKDRGTRVDAARAASVVGAYEGERTVTLRDGHLYYQRGRSPVSELIPLASGGFSLDGDARIRFADGAPAGGITIELGDGTTTRYGRVAEK